MEIKTYINDVLAHGRHAAGFPAHLDIPKAFIDYCYDLYTSGESRMIELGTTLSCAPDGSLQYAAARVDGIAGGTGINLPVHLNRTDIGDLHCHPSNSIGHKDGFAAHSPEDISSMDSHAGKPLFMRFVCSGTKIYLMVHRANLSALAPRHINTVRDGNHDLALAFFDRHCPLNEDERNEQMLAQPNGQAMNHAMRTLRRNTPGLGKEMERLSIAGASAIANHCHMGFYAGDQGYGISKTLFGYLRIYLMP